MLSSERNYARAPTLTNPPPHQHTPRQRRRRLPFRGAVPRYNRCKWWGVLSGEVRGDGGWGNQWGGGSVGPTLSLSPSLSGYYVFKQKKKLPTT